MTSLSAEVARHMLRTLRWEIACGSAGDYMTDLHNRLVDEIRSAGADTGVDERDFDRKNTADA